MGLLPFCLHRDLFRDYVSDLNRWLWVGSSNLGKLEIYDEKLISGDFGESMKNVAKKSVIEEDFLCLINGI
ncbi:hypothetical protein GCM10007426_38860 [Alloalcanivorax dieselolei]|nr:hypothetical protein GCM10007426_38860 [Alloalcanivorax dieselolei]